MEDRVYITEAFKQELVNLGCTAADYITIYRIEGNKVFFQADKCKFHFTKEELKEATLTAE
jgi:hypothetical protein